MTIRIVLADDQALLRSMIRLLIDSTPGMEVVGEAADGAEAVELALEHQADVVLMDIRMPGVDGLDATRMLAANENTSEVKVLILTTFEIDEYVTAAVRAGASGFIGKDADPADLIAAIENVAAGGALLSSVATRTLMERFQELADAPKQSYEVSLPGGPEYLAVLTPRERETLALVASGLTNSEISEHLQLSPHTVKTHVNRAMAKLGVSDRAQLVVIAYECGLVQPSGRHGELAGP